MARVTRTPQARQDLKQIARYIAEESQSRSVALEFLDTIDEKCDLYATQPEMGRLYEHHGPDIRAFPVGSYIVFYHAIDDGIEIYRVLHAARNLDDLL